MFSMFRPLFVLTINNSVRTFARSVLSGSRYPCRIASVSQCLGWAEFQGIRNGRIQPTTQINKCSNDVTSNGTFSNVTYEAVCEETLHSLLDYFETLLYIESVPKDADVTFSDGVLTLFLGQHGTYVINKQTPNRQIWLSSPISGPKRFDFVNGCWIYRHNGQQLHELLNKEMSAILNIPVDFTKCAYGNSK